MQSIKIVETPQLGTPHNSMGGSKYSAYKSRARRGRIRAHVLGEKFQIKMHPWFGGQGRASTKHSHR